VWIAIGLLSAAWLYLSAFPFFVALILLAAHLVTGVAMLLRAKPGWWIAISLCALAGVILPGGGFLAGLSAGQGPMLAIFVVLVYWPVCVYGSCLLMLLLVQPQTWARSTVNGV
jgi:hypothetical protein